MRHAIVRPPATTFAAGLTTSGLGPPDVALALRQHEAYCEALERVGLSLLRLPPDPAFPDSTFVEDAVVTTGRSAILTRPGAASRLWEIRSLRPLLREWFPEVAELTVPATLDGGDVCEAGGHFFIGLSRRTNREGATQLGEWLARQGLSSSVINMRPLRGLLHLKSGLAWLGGRRLLAVDELADHEALTGWEICRAPQGEDYAANCVLVNETLLVAEGFPATSALLGELGYSLVPLGTSEFRKMDGGLSCLSVRW